MASAQATARPCGAVEQAGPACLLVRKEMPSPPGRVVFWHLDRFPSAAAASAAATSGSVVVDSFGATWLFTLERKAWRAKGGEHVSTIGPIAVRAGIHYAAEYLRSVFAPGTKAPLHVHSGPEAFFAESGDTCLEAPGGVQVVRGPGTSLRIEAGPPMLLMAIGTVPRKGFALILHDTTKPPTTLTQAWQPSGLCERQFEQDRAGD